MTQRILRGAMDRACVLFSDLIEGRWEKVDGEFDATLRGQVLTDRFVPVWAKVVDSAGSFERIDAPSARQFGGYTLVDVPLAFAAGGAIGEVVFDRADKVAGLALEFPYPRPRQPEQRRRQWEQGIRQGGFIVRNPEIDGLMRHSALARTQPAYACRQGPVTDRSHPSPVVYVDYDPIVLAHARALMTGHPAGSTAFIHADLRDPDKILSDPNLRATLDLGRPVALTLIAVLHFVTEGDNPQGIVSTLLDALPSGSYLTITHLTADFVSPEEAAVAEAAGRNAGVTYVPRSQAEVTKFFSGLDLVDPGVVPLLAWRPDGGAPENPRAASVYAAIGRKP